VTRAGEWEPTPLPPTGKEVGIDVGLKTFATRSDGQEIATPRFFRQEEHARAKAQRTHQDALDTQKAKRAEVTARIKQEQPDLGKDAVWHVVSQDAEERAAWKERQQRRNVGGGPHT
jgi:transposase